METIQLGENSGYSLEQRKLLSGIRYSTSGNLLKVITQDGRELSVQPMAGQSTINAIYDAIQNLPNVNPEVQSLLTSGQYRDIPAGTPLTPEAIRATPVFNPNIGPQINQGYGPISAAQAGFRLNPGGGFSTIQSDINQAKALIANIKIPQRITGDMLAPTTTPNLPVSTSTSAYQNYLASSTATATNERMALEQAYQKQLDDLKRQETEAQRKIDEYTRLQKDGPIAELERLSQPFREQLENAERQRLYITENFEANQALTRELDTLLTEGNTLIAEQRAQTGLSALRLPRIAQTISDVAARASILQATMAARNNQIAVAENLIDRSVDAISADKRDRINYFSSLLDFYQRAKDEEGAKLVSLTKQEQGYIASQIGLLENDLRQATNNANYIKGLMQNPESALLTARAGITLNMPPEEVNRRLAIEIGRQEINSVKNDLIKRGYEYVPFVINKTGLIPQIVNGQTLYFRPPAEVIPTGTTGEIPITTISGKPLTDAQSTALGYARRLYDANQVINEIGGQFTGISSYFGGILPNILKSDDRQRFEQAQRNFINAVLRKESGAAISPSEFDSAAKQYFPQPGDSQDVLDQKTANRQRVIENFTTGANVPLSTLTSSTSGGSYEDYLKAIQ